MKIPLILGIKVVVAIHELPLHKLIKFLRNLSNDLYLYRSAKWEFINANRSAGVPTGISKNVIEELRCAVYYLRLHIKSWGVADVSGQLYNPLNPAEIAKLTLHYRKGVYRGKPCRLHSLLN